MQQRRHDCCALRTYPNLFSLYTNCQWQVLICPGVFITEGRFTFELTWFESQVNSIMVFLSSFTHLP